ncbi:unnamed protein product [Protopolystoma xenopodis]|uniref:Uncharacterized protein n=1 Tax=Protopolystoma xenopodis TaxID=117903 RepID=A0A3S5BZC3_9PLAT|nr:unnamed protein product [Protopolystoma xenopodis]
MTKEQRLELWNQQQQQRAFELQRGLYGQLVRNGQLTSGRSVTAGEGIVLMGRKDVNSVACMTIPQETHLLGTDSLAAIHKTSSSSAGLCSGTRSAAGTSNILLRSHSGFISPMSMPTGTAYGGPAKALSETRTIFGLRQSMQNILETVNDPSEPRAGIRQRHRKEFVRTWSREKVIVTEVRVVSRPPSAGPSSTLGSSFNIASQNEFSVPSEDDFGQSLGNWTGRELRQPSPNSPTASMTSSTLASGAFGRLVPIRVEDPSPEPGTLKAPIEVVSALPDSEHTKILETSLISGTILYSAENSGTAKLGQLSSFKMQSGITRSLESNKAIDVPVQCESTSRKFANASKRPTSLPLKMNRLGSTGLITAQIQTSDYSQKYK